jgi:hypothetical protein
MSVKLSSQLNSWCIEMYIKNLLVCLVHLLNDTISISMITPEIKLRMFLICWFVSKENTGKQMLIKRLTDFSMYNTLTTLSTAGKQKVKFKIRCYLTFSW